MPFYCSQVTLFVRVNVVVIASKLEYQQIESPIVKHIFCRRKTSEYFAIHLEYFTSEYFLLYNYSTSTLQGISRKIGRLLGQCSSGRFSTIYVRSFQAPAGPPHKYIFQVALYTNLQQLFNFTVSLEIGLLHPNER